MNLDEKIGQLFVIPANGRFMNESSAEYRELVRHVHDNHVGGIIWFASNVYETAWLNARLQELARVPLLVSADLECGLGMRFPEVTAWPTAMAIAATGEVAFAEEMGRVTAREALAIGIHHVLAPVCDVNVDPDNPVINTRSFGEDPHEVARYVAAFVRGVQSEGALATAKHFPGHGDTHTDSHRSLPVLGVDRERLERVELVPFRAAIEAGVASVMIGHLSVPALDDMRAPVREHVATNYGTTAAEVPRDATLPATVSSRIIGLLRNELRFDGLVITDAFDMGGLAAHFDAGEAAVRAIEAGEDQILFSADTDAAIRAVKEAVRSGRIREARIDESVERILRVKQPLTRLLRSHPLPRAGEGRREAPGEGLFAHIFRTVDAHRHRAEEIAQRAITLVKDDRGLLPLQGNVTAIAVIEHAEDSLDDAVRELNATRVGEPTGDEDVIVLLLAVRAKSGAGRIAIPPAALRIAREHAKKIVAVSFGSPYLLRELGDVSTYVCAYGIQPVLQRAAVRALRGTAGMTGRLPVSTYPVV